VPTLLLALNGIYKEELVKTDRRLRRTDLFLVRVWEEANDGRTEWCGKVQRPVNGEIHYFRDWPALLDLLSTMLPPGEGSGVRDRGSGISDQ